MSEPTIRVLSLGAGVQSTTLALMAREGILPDLDCAIFADTGWEPQRVYDHLDRVKTVLADAGIPLYRVRKGDLRAEAIDPRHRFASIPYFILYPDGTKGMGRRQCTNEYKLVPIRRKIRELLGASAPDYRRVPAGRVCEQWVGFSKDEIGRVSNKRDTRYLLTSYPLLELGMDRKDCQRWLRSRGWISVAKSACIGCPFMGNEEWRELRDNRPDEWADAIAFDEAIRNGGGNPLPAGAQAFLHASCVPLAIAPIDRVTAFEWGRRQGDIFDAAADAELQLRLEKGNPDGCSPYGCRSGQRVMAAT